jgi:hypothetical protein
MFFLLATSDSDFTALATRLREEGVTVIGAGRNIAPPSFVKGCDQFLTLESMEGVQPVAEKDAEKIEHEQRKSPSPVTKPQLQEEGRDLLVRAAKQAAHAGDGIIRWAFLGSVLRRLDPKFSSANYGVSSVSKFIGLYPDVLIPTGKRSGVDPTYKLVSN